MSENFNNYIKRLNEQEVLNENIRGDANPKISIERESGSYTGLITDAEKKLNEVTTFSNPKNQENIPEISDELMPNPEILALKYKPEYSVPKISNDEQELILNPEIDIILSDLNTDPEKALLAETLNIDPKELNDLNVTAEELSVIVNLQLEVFAAKGLSPENVNIGESQDYSGISPEIYAIVTGGDLLKDIGFVDPENAVEVEIGQNVIYNRDTDLSDLRNELETASKPSINETQEPEAWTSKYKPDGY